MMFKQDTQRKVHQQALSIRSTLYQKGQNLQFAVTKAKHDHNKVPTEATKHKLTWALAELASYVAIRQALTPTIASDQALSAQQGMICKLKRELGL